MTNICTSSSLCVDGSQLVNAHSSSNRDNLHHFAPQLEERRQEARRFLFPHIFIHFHSLLSALEQATPFLSPRVFLLIINDMMKFRVGNFSLSLLKCRNAMPTAVQNTIDPNCSHRKTIHALGPNSLPSIKISPTFPLPPVLRKTVRLAKNLRVDLGMGFEKPFNKPLLDTILLCYRVIYNDNKGYINGLFGFSFLSKP
ncbi:hypothetical protein CEXT_56941 [Caerostris extrusa]|uniref:Uncharacterized protein n=1 Tax=Caerostris extrusa TaxID=172846 RepID=A0AAV4MA92_CAEEX|nr:hypothetical protein CEXT_56941 [Caerostris extrusa]